MKKLFVLTAIYGEDYEWSSEDLVGVYDSLDKAEEARTLFEETIKTIMSEECPITTEDIANRFHGLEESRLILYQDYLDRRGYKECFKNTNIQTTILNEKP